MWLFATGNLVGSMATGVFWCRGARLFVCENADICRGYAVVNSAESIGFLHAKHDAASHVHVDVVFSPP